MWPVNSGNPPAESVCDCRNQHVAGADIGGSCISIFNAIGKSKTSSFESI
uniref:Uncharacterized protein n=1 Tax=Arundo donax TaxID=35708 RepID=A0A0A9AYS9_ARUDO